MCDILFICHQAAKIVEGVGGIAGLDKETYHIPLKMKNKIRKVAQNNSHS